MMKKKVNGRRHCAKKPCWTLLDRLKEISEFEKLIGIRRQKIESFVVISWEWMV